MVVTVTNIRETGGIGITKSLSGPISGAPTTFSAFLDCDGDAYDQTVSLTLAPPDLAGTVLVAGIPTGTHCVFTEPNNPTAMDPRQESRPTRSPSRPPTSSRSTSSTSGS